MVYPVLMGRPTELKAFYDGWAEQQKRIVDSIRPLSLEQMRLRPTPTEWPIWRLASNIAGGRLYWLCSMLKRDDLGVSIDEWGRWWDDAAPQPGGGELVRALERTWAVVEHCLDGWSLDDMNAGITSQDARGQLSTFTPAWVINRLMSHEYHHGSEIALILRMHGLPTAIAG
jgi:uncharacterized damage-inducible protein DinB